MIRRSRPRCTARNLPPADKARDQPRGIASALYGGSAALLLIQGAGASLSFGLHALLVRIAGAEQYGHFAYALNWLAILLLVCHLGLNTSSLRFVSAYDALRDWSSLRGFLRFTRSAVVVASLSVAAVTVLWVQLMGPRLDRDFGSALAVIGMGLPWIALLTLWGAQLRAFRKIAASQAPLSIVFPIVAMMLAVGILDEVETRAWHLALVYVASMGIGAALSGVFVFRAAPSPTRKATSSYEYREWWSVTSPMLVIAFLQIIQLRLTTTVLGFVVPAEDLARYTVALRLSTLAAFGFAAVSAWASPLIAQRDSLGDRDGIQRIARLGARATFTFGLVVISLLGLLGDWLLALFDPSFTDAFATLMVLAVAELLTCLTGTAGSLLIMTGHQAVATRIEAAVAAVAVVASALLIPAYGMLGAASATLVTSGFRNSVLALIVWRRLRIRCGVL